ncbi:MAG TPA: hypothetical protein VMJ90_04730 [Anaerolineales bacterium]|nr:hypothetical protein [Anaerolineales bacterium]
MFIIMYHSLLIGASLFAPIPFLDEKLAAFLWKRMVSELAKNHKRTLSEEQLAALSYQYKFVLSGGCLYVLKRIFKQISQEVIFFLEWGKALDMATDAYYSGYLLNELFSSDTFDHAKIDRYAVAMQNAKKGFNKKLMRGVIKGTFQSSRGVLWSIIKWLTSIAADTIKDIGKRAIRRRNDPAIEKSMGGFFEQNKAKLESLINQLKTQFDEGLGGVPAQHFEVLKNKMFAELQVHENS